MSSPPSPSQVPSRLQSQSVGRLAAHLDGVSLGIESQSHSRFVGGFKVSTPHSTGFRKPGEEKPLPPPPVSVRAASDLFVPPSLRPASGRHAREYQPAVSGASLFAPQPRPNERRPLTPAMPIPPVAAAAPSPISTPTRPSSFPPSPPSIKKSSSPGFTVQCSGIKQNGKQCTRRIKAPSPSPFISASSEMVPQFCFQHGRVVLEQSGFYPHKPGAEWVKFQDWIPAYLHPETQAALRLMMEKPADDKDGPGYVYAYEIRDDVTSDKYRIKVGESEGLVKRLAEWGKQCKSKEVILRGWWPGTIKDGGAGRRSLLRGNVVAGEKGPFCFRLEQLVHIELADLAVYTPYLQPGFPETVAGPKGGKINGPSTPSTPGRSPKPKKARMPRERCVDCGVEHREIFTLRKVQKFQNMEWEQLVKPVIERWGNFVDQYV